MHYTFTKYLVYNKKCHSGSKKLGCYDCRYTCVRYTGYKALMRYEGFSNDVSHDFWVNLCTQDVHPVGWCATMGKSLVPPKSMYLFTFESQKLLRNRYLVERHDNIFNVCDLFAAIQHKYTDWKDFLVKRLTGARTLPQNFYNKVQDTIHDHPMRKSVKVEVVDKMCVSAMRVATVEETIGGRLHLVYHENKPAVR